MAAKQIKIPPPPQLVKDKEELKALIQKRIMLGTEILAIPVSNSEEKASRWARFKRWDDLNYEIITTAFDQRRHTHEYEYEYHQGIDPYEARGMRARKTLADEIQQDFDAIAYQLEKLNAFYDKIDLQHVAPGVERKMSAKEIDDGAPLLNLLDRFHLAALQLLNRHGSRETLKITDEYDVQDLLHTFLQLHYEDIRPEEYTPSYAGGASRMDFLLKREKIVVEVKMTRAGLRTREIGDELTIDIARYRSHPDCKRLICFVYDPDRLISNPRGVEDDLQRQSSPEMRVEVVIRS
jgi:hypothetical protein